MDGMNFLVSLVNPLALSPLVWLAGVATKEAALQGMDVGVAYAGRFMKALPSRTGSKPLYEHQLDSRDSMYLACNSVLEVVFVSHIFRLILEAPQMDRSLGAFGLFNGPVALLLLILFNDMLYAPAHRLLHHPLLYKHIHKHHHRSTFPKRGSVDARNEHPLEQLIAMCLWWTAIWMVISTVGMHVVALGAHLTFMSIGTCMNHTGIDVDCRFLGIDWFSVRAHEMHHRRPDKNFAQFTMFWDKLMGTYIPYADLDEKRRAD